MPDTLWTIKLVDKPFGHEYAHAKTLTTATAQESSKIMHLFGFPIMLVTRVSSKLKARL